MTAQAIHGSGLKLPASFSRADLEQVGFKGWKSLEELRRTDFAHVPVTPLVYVAYRAAATPVSFLKNNPGGRFKQKDPTVSAGTLRQNWVPDALVVYIDKADQEQRRLKQFGRFGAGEPVGHWGGRLVWQLQDAWDLNIAWHEISWNETARDYEKRLLQHFMALHQARPFANLTG